MLVITLTIVFFIAIAVITTKYFFLLFKQNIRKNIEYFGLTGKDFYENRFINILNAFLTGCNYIFRHDFSSEKCNTYLKKHFPPFYQGFAYEGAGMGLGVRANLSINKGKKFEYLIKELSLNHVYQYYVGLGWWLNIRYKFNEKGYEKWIQQMDSNLAPIVFEGVGFRTGLYNNQKNLDFSIFKKQYQRICYQGYGRSVWFNNQFNIDQVVAYISTSQVDDLEDTYSGVGLAVAYSLFDETITAITLVDKIPIPYKIPFVQGMAFGWETRKRQNSIYWEDTMKSLPDNISEYIENCVSIVRETQYRIRTIDKTNYYVKWMDLTREKIELSKWGIKSQ